VGLDGRGLQILDAIVADETLPDENFTYWKTHRFTNEAGLLADPTSILREPENWERVTVPGLAAFRNALFSEGVLHECLGTYRAKFTDKRSLLDYEKFGNFHQILGQHLMVSMRVDPDEWWIDQKFKPGQNELQRNLYHAVQYYFLQTEIPHRFGPGQRVIDIGCGPGFFTEMIAATGADTVGYDPSQKFLDIALNRDGRKASYVCANVGAEGSLSDIDNASFDAVFMSDALLFYFVPPSPDGSTDLAGLLSEIKRILKPGGRFISVEPHYLFWLAPWLGAEDDPFTVITEYDDHVYRVTGTPVQLIRALLHAGFVVSGIEEAKPDPAFKAVDSRAYHFAHKFPLWQLVEASVLE